MTVADGVTERHWLPLLAAILVLAAISFAWSLQASSYFVDEIYSLRAATQPLGRVLDQVRAEETAPPLFYWTLHEWIGRTGAGEEWEVRVPSVLAGLALVAAVFWLGSLVGGRRAGLLAALLAALSPLVLQYSQQARAYVFAMLAATVAVACALQSRGSARAALWLALAAAASATAVWFHYVSWLAVGPLALWVLLRRDLPRSWRGGYVAAVALASLLVLPLMQDQFNRHPGLGNLAPLNTLNVVKILETPWDGRTFERLNALRVLAAAATVGGVGLFAWRWRGERSVRLLLLVLAVAAPVVVLLMGIGGRSVLLTRNTAIAVPFLLVVLAAGVLAAPRPAGIAVLAALVVAGVVGVAGSHRPLGHYPDARGVMETIDPRWRPGDVIVDAEGETGTNISLRHYAERVVGPGTPLFSARDQAADAQRATAARSRLWVVSAGFAPAEGIRAGAAGIGYSVRRIWRFPGDVSLTLVLAEPAGGRR